MVGMEVVVPLLAVMVPGGGVVELVELVGVEEVELDVVDVGPVVVPVEDVVEEVEVDVDEVGLVELVEEDVVLIDVVFVEVVLMDVTLVLELVDEVVGPPMDVVFEEVDIVVDVILEELVDVVEVTVVPLVFVTEGDEVEDVVELEELVDVVEGLDVDIPVPVVKVDTVPVPAAPWKNTPIPHCGRGERVGHVLLDVLDSELLDGRTGCRLRSPHKERKQVACETRLRRKIRCNERILNGQCMIANKQRRTEKND